MSKKAGMICPILLFHHVSAFWSDPTSLALRYVQKYCHSYFPL